MPETLTLQRLNMDSSWWLHWANMTCWIDPWLIGSEIDGTKWLNEQWHTTPPIHIDALPDTNAILISQSYEDHCHLNTLSLLDAALPILATEKAVKRLRKAFPKRKILSIPNLPSADWLDFGELKLAALHPGHKRDPVYFAVIIAHREQAIFYAPHGFILNESQYKWLSALQFKVLMATFTDFRLPTLMGGQVNLGLKNAQTLAQQLSALHVVNTHDEQKQAKGLVSHLAKIRYADLSQVTFAKPAQFVTSPDYAAITL